MNHQLMNEINGARVGHPHTPCVHTRTHPASIPCVYTGGVWSPHRPSPPQIQEQEGLLAEKRRECKEVRAAYGTLRADYERLRADLEGAEARVGRLKQVPGPPVQRNPQPVCGTVAFALRLSRATILFKLSIKMCR